MKIYTKTGDQGETGLVGGDRVGKVHARIQCLGVIDELNAHLGLARSSASEPVHAATIERVQSQLFDLGAEIATPHDSPYFKPSIFPEDISQLEGEIDVWTDQLEPLRNFILPGGSLLSTHLHLCRTVCRRAEIQMLLSQAENEFREETLIYINRLSDWLFTFARFANHCAQVSDIKWLGRTER